MVFGRFRRGPWAYLGVAILIAWWSFGRRVLGPTNDLSVRLMLMVVLIAVVSGAMVLMSFKGPDAKR